MAMLNVASLTKHLDEIRLLLYDKKLDVLALNETRLDSSISDELVAVDGYDLIRADRNRNGGGVCIYIRCHVNYGKRLDLVPTDLEGVCLEINQANSRSFIITSIYRPPSAPVEIFSKIEKLIELLDDKNKEVYILGDLNCNMLEPTLLPTKKLNEILELYQMRQLINNPTRVTELTQSLLDVCITSNPEHITHSGVLHLGISDHSLIYAIRKINAKPVTESQGYVEIRNFKKFKSTDFLNDLYGVPWDEIRNKSDVDGMWEIWKTLFIDVLNKHAPIRSKRTRKRGNIPWLNSEVKTKLFKRDYLKKKAIQTNDENDWKLYRVSRNDANSALRSAKKDYYANKFTNHHQNPKASWKTINDILGRGKKQDVIKEIKLPEKTVTSTKELVDVFNEHFINIGPNLAEAIQNENDGNFRDFINKQDSEFSFQPVSVTMVYNLINKLSTSKATGFDKISAKVLRAAASAIAPSLTEIFNISMDSNQFPSDWKTARVIPLFKKGQRSVLDNYRPISILPVVSKIMERLLYNQIFDYFTKKDLLSKHQFGFRPFHSTTTTLLDCTNEWYVNMDRGLYNLVVLLDLKKAFDTVNHEILLHKLQMYGFKTKALNFMRDYLTNRTQRCQLEGLLSDQREVRCGIPQGSILGPLLFIIYINDLPNCLKSTTPRMFADDTNLTAVGETLGEAEEKADIDLRNVQKWLSLNKLSLNIVKTEYIMIASRHKINRIDIEPTVRINSQHIKRVKCTEVLGVQIDEHLNWKQHIEYIVNKISSGIGALRKLRAFIDTSTLVLVYNSLIQPYFDYCCEVWDTIGKGLSERLQKLQNRAARLIMNLKNEHGQSALARNSLGWKLLEERRAEMKARIMYKTVNKLAPSRLCDLFQNVKQINDYNLRGSSRVHIPMPKTEFLKRSFCYNGAKLWNQIPDEIRSTVSLASFCKKLSSSTLDLSS